MAACICRLCFLISLPERVCIKVTDMTSIWPHPTGSSLFSSCALGSANHSFLPQILSLQCFQNTAPAWFLPTSLATVPTLLYPASKGRVSPGSLLFSGCHLVHGPTSQLYPQIHMLFSSPIAAMIVHHLLLDWEILLTGLLVFQLILPLS